MTTDSHERGRALSAALVRFFAEPDDEGFALLAERLAPLVIGQAARWRDAGLDFAERCQELLAEIFLLLVTKVDRTRIDQPGAIITYLEYSLMKLTRSGGGRVIPFGAAADLPDLGRSDFVGDDLDLVETIVGVIRRLVANAQPASVRRLEAAFIHLEPNLRAASRLAGVGEPPGAGVAVGLSDDRYEADKKRHQAFNRRLRETLEERTDGEFRRVLDWPRGRRSHLGWRLISFDPVERQAIGEAIALAFDAVTAQEQPLVALLERPAELSRWAEHLDGVVHGLRRLYPEGGGEVVAAVAGRRLEKHSPSGGVGRGPTAAKGLGAPGALRESPSGWGAGAGDDDLLAMLLGLGGPPVALRSGARSGWSEPATEQACRLAYDRAVAALRPMWREVLAPRLRPRSGVGSTMGGPPPGVSARPATGSGCGAGLRGGRKAVDDFDRQPGADRRADPTDDGEEPGD